MPVKKLLTRYVIDNNGVTHVPAWEAYVVKGQNEKKNYVNLLPERCQYTSSGRCYHIIAVRMFVGIPEECDDREVSLWFLLKEA